MTSSVICFYQIGYAIHLHMDSICHDVVLYGLPSLHAWHVYPEDGTLLMNVTPICSPNEVPSCSHLEVEAAISSSPRRNSGNFTLVVVWIVCCIRGASLDNRPQWTNWKEQVYGPLNNKYSQLYLNPFSTCRSWRFFYSGASSIYHWSQQIILELVHVELNRVSGMSDARP